MSDRAYKRWSCGLLLTLLLVLGACAAVVYWVDPCFYYRMPKDRAPVFFSERYQTAGIVRNNAADVVLLGSSMTANYRGSKVGAVFGGTGLRLTIPDGYYSEFDEVMTLLADTAENLAVVTNWATRYPDVEFDLFFSPYSILYWDKIDRMGETDAVFAALELACKTLLPYENITLHGLLFDRDIIEQLDYYCDYVHHSAEAGELVLAKLSSGADRLTEENYRKTLANWRDFVVNYDYEKFWDEHYWYQFHTPNNS